MSNIEKDTTDSEINRFCLERSYTGKKDLHNDKTAKLQTLPYLAINLSVSVCTIESYVASRAEAIFP